MAAAMLAEGGRCDVQVWPGQAHAFPLAGARDKLPEGIAAVDHGSRFLAQP